MFARSNAASFYSSHEDKSDGGDQDSGAPERSSYYAGVIVVPSSTSSMEQDYEETSIALNYSASLDVPRRLSANSYIRFVSNAAASFGSERGHLIAILAIYNKMLR